MYLAGKRDLRIDLLRGAAILAMVVDHVGGDDSWLYLLTGGNRFYVSAAEAFVFLAGVVSGIVYGGVARRDGAGAAAVKMLRRAGVLYAWTAGLTLVVPFAATALGLGWEDPLHDTSLAQFIPSVLTLHRTYYLVDALLLYVLLFSVAGLAVALMMDGKTAVVLALSWAVWLVWQLFPTLAQVPWPIQGMEVFQPAAWQALYVTGLAIGFHRDALAARLRRQSGSYLAAGGLGLGLAVTMYRFEQQVFEGLAPHADPQMLANILFSKADLRIGRLVAFTFASALAFSLATLAWRHLESWLGWLLIPLGQNSLTAYVLHIGVVMSLTKVGQLTFEADGRGPGQNVLLQLTGVFAVWLLVQLMVAAKRRRWRPVCLGAAESRPVSTAPIPLRLADAA